MTDPQILDVLSVIGVNGPCTIVDLWDFGFARGKPLHEVLRALERVGKIESRLEFAHSRHRIYRVI